MAKKQNTGSTIGRWAFLIGVVLAVILGFGLITNNNTWTVVLLVIGLIIGLLNITEKEASSFLMSGVVLIIASSLGGSALSSINWVEGIFNALLAIFVPATIIVAIRHVFSVARH